MSAPPDPSHPSLTPEVVSRTALATLRRHAASPLTGTPPFWERLARTVLEAYLSERINGVPTGEQVAAVARSTAPAFSSSPVTNSETLWNGIVSTVVTEYLSPSGMGETIPRKGPRHFMSDIEDDDAEGLGAAPPAEPHSP